MYLRLVAAVCIQLAVAAAVVLQTCNRDDCLRAVIASAMPSIHGSADCSSFFKTIVTLAPTIITKSTIATVTSTLTIKTSAYPNKKRDAAPTPMLVPRQVTVKPSSTPSYASVCSGTARYSSACSCIGATHTTSTAPIPTTTTTVYTGTTTITKCASPDPTFVLQIENSHVTYSGIPLDGTWGQLDTGDGPLIGFNGAPRSLAVPLSITSDGGHLTFDNYVSGVIGFTNHPANQTGLILFTSPPTFGLDVTGCYLGGGQLHCSNDGYNPNNHDYQFGANIFAICPNAAVTNDLWIGNIIDPGCVAVTLNAIELCAP